MNGTTFTPQQALDVLKKLGALETLKLNLAEHAAIQQALNVIEAVVNKPADTNKEPADLKVL